MSRASPCQGKDPDSIPGFGVFSPSRQNIFIELSIEISNVDAVEEKFFTTISHAFWIAEYKLSHIQKHVILPLAINAKSPLKE